MRRARGARPTVARSSDRPATAVTQSGGRPAAAAGNADRNLLHAAARDERLVDVVVRADVRRAVEKAQGRLCLWRRARARWTQKRERHLVGGIVVREKRRERRIGKKRAEERTS